jgi:hypothetical protein
MCSTPGERLARISRAIDELAADSLAPHRSAPETSIGDRLARIWAMIGELDPELARRIPGYRRGARPKPQPGSGQEPAPGHGREGHAGP